MRTARIYKIHLNFKHLDHNSVVWVWFCLAFFLIFVLVWFLLCQSYFQAFFTMVPYLFENAIDLWILARQKKSASPGPATAPMISFGAYAECWCAAQGPTSASHPVAFFTHHGSRKEEGIFTVVTWTCSLLRHWMGKPPLQCSLLRNSTS